MLTVCLLLFFLLSVLGFLLLIVFPLACPQPSTEHRKVSHAFQRLSVSTQGAGVTPVATLNFVLFEGESVTADCPEETPFMECSPVVLSLLSPWSLRTKLVTGVFL